MPFDDSRNSNALPLLAGALAAASFVSMDAVIKLMTPRYDALQLSFFRFAGGSVFALLLWAWKRTPLPERAAWRLHVVRSLFLLVSLVGYFHALTQLPLALAVTISYLAPIFVSVLAIPVLKERPAPSIWAALGLGLAGVAISLWPELQAGLDGKSTARLLGMLSAAVAAVSFAFVMLFARKQSRSDSVWTILLIQSLLPLVLLAAPAAWSWKPLLASDLLWILRAGGLGTLGLLCLTYAFTRLEASRVAPLEYSSFVWAAGLGYLLFGEVPTLTTALSAALIIGGCLLLLRR
ncbi:MAG: DMT family transporter [Burkholderiales bacterium]|nr:DMT family transporter [Burkholderiales bacterium]